MPSCLILPCAGSGERLGGQSKQMRLLAHKPIFIQSLRVFTGLIDHIIIPCSENLKAEIQAALDAEGIKAQLVNGGRTRLASVSNALQACPQDCDKVLIHDAVRPCIKHDTIQACLDALDQNDAVLTAIPCSDTLKLTENGLSLKTIDRDQVYLAQTPQGFNLQNTTLGLRAIYAAAAERGDEFTDDASLCEAHGIRVRIVLGSRDNMKVTYAEDLELAEYLLSRQHKS